MDGETSPRAEAPEQDVDALLAELAAEGSAPVKRERERGPDEVAPSTEALRRRIIAQAGRGDWVTVKDGLKRLRYTHDDCVDRTLMTPGITQKDLAMLYGVTETWISIVTNCDAFKAKLAERRAELIDPTLLASLNERYGALARKSVDILLEKLSQPIEKISDKLALEAASLGAKAMGLGQPAPPPAGNATDHLAALAHRLIDLNNPAPQTLDGETRRID